MALIRKSGSEKNESVSTETVQNDEVELTPRQKVDARISQLRSSALSKGCLGIINVSGAVVQTVMGDRVGVMAGLE